MKAKWMLGSWVAVLFWVCGCGGNSPGPSLGPSSGGTVHAAGFTNANFIGGYGFVSNGSSFLLSSASSGVLTADGNGNLISGEETVNNGLMSCHGTFSGTYSINANGTGTAITHGVLDAPSIAAGCRNGGTSHYSLALSNGGSQVAFAEQDLTLVSSGIATKQ